MKPLFAVSLCLLGCVCAPLGAQSVSPLFERGYTVLPTPQKVELGAKDIELTREWRLQVDKTAQGDIAADELSALLAERYHLRFGNSKTNSAGPIVRLAIGADSTAVTGVNDRDKDGDRTAGVSSDCHGVGSHNHGQFQCWLAVWRANVRATGEGAVGKALGS